MSTNLDDSMATLGQLNTQTRDTLRDEFEQLLIRHAQDECLQLSNKLHQTLPTELCDLIYQYLYIEDAPIRIGPHEVKSHPHRPHTASDPENIYGLGPPDQLVNAIAASLGPGAVIHDHSHEPPDDVVYPTHYTLDPAYMGAAVAHEASKLYYSANTFSICTLDDAIPAFLLKNTSHNFPKSHSNDEQVLPLGIVPINHVRNLQIRLKYEHLSIFPADEIYDDEQELLDKMFLNLMALTSTTTTTTTGQQRPPPPNRSIEFIIMTDFVSLMRISLADVQYIHRHITNILETLRKPFYTLKYDFDDVDLTVLHYNESYAFPDPMTDRFSMSRGDWEKDKAYFVESEIAYSPLDWLVAPEGQEEECEEILIGFAFSWLHFLLQERWACDSSLEPVPEWQPKVSDRFLGQE
jgi:hypothetical protein